MNNRFITTAIIVLVAFVSSVTALAQSKIDNIVAELEKQKDVQVTYTERRNPKTKKLIKQSIILNGNSKSQAEKLWSAFERERTNSVSVTKTRDRSFVMKFENSQGQSSYVLSINGGSWSLVITMRGTSESDDDDSASCDFDFNLNSLDALASLNNLDGLDELDCLDELEGLNSLDNLNGLNNIGIDVFDGNVTVYDGQGKVIIKKSVDSSSAKSSAKKAKSSAKSKSRSKSISSSISTSNGRTVNISNGSTMTTTYTM